MLALAIASISAATCIYLLTGRGMLWLGRERDGGRQPSPGRWPPVAVVIPARNEAAVIGESVGSLLRQDYAGPLAVFVVDDDSDDGTAAAAQQAAAGVAREVTILGGQKLPSGWTGK